MSDFDADTQRENSTAASSKLPVSCLEPTAESAHAHESVNAPSCGSNSAVDLPPSTNAITEDLAFSESGPGSLGRSVCPTVVMVDAVTDGTIHNASAGTSAETAAEPRAGVFFDFTNSLEPDDKAMAASSDVSIMPPGKLDEIFDEPVNVQLVEKTGPEASDDDYHRPQSLITDSDNTGVRRAEDTLQQDHDDDNHSSNGHVIGTDNLEVGPVGDTSKEAHSDNNAHSKEVAVDTNQAQSDDNHGTSQEAHDDKNSLPEAVAMDIDDPQVSLVRDTAQGVHSDDNPRSEEVGKNKGSPQANPIKDAPQEAHSDNDPRSDDFSMDVDGSGVNLGRSGSDDGTKTSQVGGSEGRQGLPGSSPGNPIEIDDTGLRAAKCSNKGSRNSPDHARSDSDTNAINALEEAVRRLTPSPDHLRSKRRSVKALTTRKRPEFRTLSLPKGMTNSPIKRRRSQRSHAHPPDYAKSTAVGLESKWQGLEECFDDQQTAFTILKSKHETALHDLQGAIHKFGKVQKEMTEVQGKMQASFEEMAEIRSDMYSEVEMLSALQK
ncbi:hypothetical protein ACLMJK_004886 [Lecanora helva]